MKKVSSLSMGLVLIVLLGAHGFAQCQKQKLVASDGQRWDQFGCAVAIDGDWAAIGAQYASPSGAVYMFQRVGSSWLEMQKLTGNDPAGNNVFGFTLAMAGNVLVVGDPGSPSAGAAYVFENVGGVWSQTTKLLSGDPDPQDEFGIGVATTGDRILVSAPADDQHGQDAGAVYVFDRAGATWVQTAKLMGSDTVPFDGFGVVSLGVDQALVGVPSKAGPGGSGVGAAYVFVNGPNGWTQAQKLIASDGAAGDYFGDSVAMFGTLALVGAPVSSHCSSQGGVIYGFEKTMSAWTQVQELCTDDAGAQDLFGINLAVSGDHFLSGSNVPLAGSAYDFRLSGSTWTQAGKMLANDGVYSDEFGGAVALSGDTALIGALGGDDACTNDPNCESGAAYIFQLAPTATQYGHCPSGAPCNNIDNHGGCRNSTAQGAILTACGSGSALLDDLQLEATHCPANKSTLLFMGGIQVTAPFADGIRVVGGGVPGIYRFGIIQSDASGTAMRGPGLVAHSQGFHSNGRIQAGQVWNFQVWYRDLAGPCGHLTNYSNGVQVAFTP
jgi:hypothetical protein